MRVPLICKQDDLQSMGLSCSEDEPCPMYLELEAVEASGNRLLVAGNIHTAASTVSSILLSSADGGKTWTEPYDRIRFAALEQIQFIDFENGWISGAAIQTLPRDPFFLSTDDGGKTWRQRAVFDDTHGGNIDRFWFDSRTSGTLLLSPIGESYEMYETTNGGGTWSMKQSGSKPLTLTRGKSGDPGWRLRADSRNHSYDVEVKQGSGWQRVASFLVEMGACR
jgi:photosystem II stability/assembly factor-like uncharacterized protein